MMVHKVIQKWSGTAVVKSTAERPVPACAVNGAERSRSSGLNWLSSRNVLLLPDGAVVFCFKPLSNAHAGPVRQAFP
jgi:hypothetical protein